MSFLLRRRLRPSPAAVLLAGAGLIGPAAAEPVALRILETTDLHMNLLAYDYYRDEPTERYGLARTARLIRAARAEAANSLLFDNGDLLQGGPMGDVVAKAEPLQGDPVHPAYRALGRLGVDAANLGNHDFNFGLPFLRRAMAGAAFPIVNANVVLDDAAASSDRPHPAFAPYALLDRELVDAAGARHPIRIGVIGFAPPQIMAWDKAHLEGRVLARGIVETARRLVPEMRARGAQLVIAIPHSGLETTEGGPLAENAVGALARVPGIDAILFGHSHAEFPGPDFADRPGVDLARGTVHGVPAVMPGRWGDHLGVIDLTLESPPAGDGERSGQWTVRDSRASIRPIYDQAAMRALVDSDPDLVAELAPEHARTLAHVRERVAETAVPIDSYFAQASDDASVQLVADAQAAYVRRALRGTAYEALPVLSAAAPFKTGGRQGWSYYTDIPAGPLAIRNVADLYVYPNTLKAVLVTGAEVREWLERSAGQFRRVDPAGPAVQALVDESFPSFNFDTLDGVSYAFDVTQPARYDARGTLVAPDAHRVRDLSFEGRPIDPAACFVVATNNYRAFGGGDFPGLGARAVVLDSPDENRQVLIDFLAARAAASPDHRIDARADGNWRVRPVPGVTLTFASSSAAVARLGRHPDVRLVRDRGDGSALFALTP